MAVSGQERRPANTATVTHNVTGTYTYNGGIEACNNLAEGGAARSRTQEFLVVTIAYNMTGQDLHGLPGRVFFCRDRPPSV